MQNLKKIIIVIFVSMLWGAQNDVVFCQRNGGVQVSFKNPDTESSISEFASNVLRIVNRTNSLQKLNLMINPPAGWQLIGNPVSEITINANDSLFVPVRLKQRGDIRGGMTYVANAFVMVRGFTVASAVWNISIVKKSKWYVKTSSNKVYFTAESDSTSFYLDLINDGNSDEPLLIKLKPGNGILIKNSRGELLKEISERIQLKAGKDTFVVYTVVRDDLPSLPDDRETTGENMYRMNLLVVDEDLSNEGKKRWQGRISFVKLKSERKIKESSFISFPLTVEFNSYNILTDNTYATLSLYGYDELGKNRSLSYYYQGSFIKNQIKWRSYLGNYFYVGYFSDRYTAEVGDITSGQSGSRLIGKGLKGSARLYGHELGALYIANPSPFDDPVISGGGVFYNYNADKLGLKTYYESSKNNVQRYNSNFVSAELSYKINPRHLVRVGGGFSIQDYKLLNEKYSGYKAIAGYTGNVKKLNINLNARYHSQHYAPWNGNVNMNGIVSYPLNHTTRLRGGASYYKNQPAIVQTDGSVRDSLFTGRNVFYFQLSHTKDNGVFYFKPEYIMFTSTWLNVNTGGLNFDYRLKASNKMSFYSSVFAGGSGYPELENIDPIFVASVRLSFRYKNFNTNLRYYFGPYYLNEQYYYVSTLQNPQRIYLMAYYNWWFAHNRLSLETNLNYNYATMYKRNQVVIRPELFYYSLSRFRFSIYMNYMVFANGEYERYNYPLPNYAPVNSNYHDNVVPADVTTRFEVGFGIKFDLNVPVGKRKNYNAVMIVFRDANGNGIKDRDEQGYANMLIRVTKVDESFNEGDDFALVKDIYELITDKDGVVEYSHLPKGNYKIESIPLMASEGWFGSRKMYKFIDGNQIIYIPLSKGAKLSGGIFVERDSYSDEKPVQIGGIRVTAVNQLTGESYSTLTDKYGNYSMHLPNGDYVITINEGAVGTRFSFTDNNIPISIKSSGKSYNIGFYLSEKKRQIRFNRGRSASEIIRKSPIVDNRNQTGNAEKAGPDLMDVSEGLQASSGYVIKLFAGERALMLKSEFDTLQNVTNIYCVKGEGGQYLYYTNALTRKKDAKSLLKKIKELGFGEAELIDLNAVNDNKKRKKTNKNK